VNSLWPRLLWVLRNLPEIIVVLLLIRVWQVTAERIGPPRTNILSVALVAGLVVAVPALADRGARLHGRPRQVEEFLGFWSNLAASLAIRARACPSSASSLAGNASSCA
jgi:hypothetical protein